jgi:hypothetical protein
LDFSLDHLNLPELIILNGFQFLATKKTKSDEKLEAQSFQIGKIKDVRKRIVKLGL